MYSQKIKIQEIPSRGTSDDLHDVQPILSPDRVDDPTRYTGNLPGKPRIFVKTPKLKRFSRFRGRVRGTAGVASAVFLCVAALLAVPGEATAADTVIYLVRHAEKAMNGDDPALSAAGRERARALADLLENAPIDRIHSTDFRRTRETAEPLARRRGLPVDPYDPERPGDLVQRILGAGGGHLVIGHSNTVPELVDLLGGTGGLPIDEAGEYDRLYVVTRTGDGSTRTELRRYGARLTP